MWMDLAYQFDADPDPDPNTTFFQIWAHQCSTMTPLRLPPVHFDADADPAFHFDQDPNLAVHFDEDPDPQNWLDKVFPNSDQ